jgi:hypothetical protein
MNVVKNESLFGQARLEVIFRGARAKKTGFLSKVSKEREEWARLGVSCETVDTGAAVIANVKTGERGTPAAELYAAAERKARELQTAQPEHVVLLGITKMQRRQGVLDVTCDAVAPIEKP